MLGLVKAIAAARHQPLSIRTSSGEFDYLDRRRGLRNRIRSDVAAITVV
ncbi:MAG: hypothetical protein P8O03_10485 [Ilumatobacter sp.]|nr:hypothetical protein [Ilumatobacter sp.]